MKMSVAIGHAPIIAQNVAKIIGKRFLWQDFHQQKIVSNYSPFTTSAPISCLSLAPITESEYIAFQ